MLYLLPGLDGTGELFAPLQATLNGQLSYRIIRYKHEVEFADYVETAASALTLPRGENEHIILVAESFSGPIALELLYLYPSRIRAAVLSATFATSPFRPLTRLGKFMPAAFLSPSPLQNFILNYFCINRESHPQLFSNMLRVTREVGAQTFKSRIEILATLDMHPRLNFIKTPILYLKGLQDRVVPPRLSHNLVKDLQQVNELAIDGPHMLLQTRPQQCTDAIINWLGRQIENNRQMAYS